LININCSSNCKYQKDGICHLDKVQMQKVHGNSECIYFTANPIKKIYKESHIS